MYLRSYKIFGCTYDSIQSGVHKTHVGLVIGCMILLNTILWTPGLLVVNKGERLVSRTATNLIQI